MWIVFLLVIAAAPALVFFLGRAGRKLRAKASEPLPKVYTWPSVGLVIPCAGTHPAMEGALRSLLEQDYEGKLRYVFVTATMEEPAANLVERLAEEYGEKCTIDHVAAGRAEKCGQKNWNSLAAVRFLGDSVEVYAFCDSTHMASPDFVTRLVLPVARKEAPFATGYHEVVPRDNEFVTLAYAFTVLCMRLMQSLSGYTQPWGGAMAIDRQTFQESGIGRHWEENVVDDCSLASFLPRHRIRVALSPSALLRTRAEHHSFDVWWAWLERQILFLKFCVPSQWYQLGLVLFLMALAPTLALFAFLGCNGFTVFAIDIGIISYHRSQNIVQLIQSQLFRIAAILSDASLKKILLEIFLEFFSRLNVDHDFILSGSGQGLAFRLSFSVFA